MHRAFFQLFATVAALACLFVQPSFAQDYRSRTVGGPGGDPFEWRCPRGSYLVGLQARSGEWVDAIGALCARWDHERSAFLRSPFESAGAFMLRGGPGGARGETRCDDVSAITHLIVEEANNEWSSVSLLVPVCAQAQDTSRRTRRSGARQFGRGIADRAQDNDDPNIGTSAQPYYDMGRMPQCRQGDLAVGIFGGAGNLLDSIGLICAPAPRFIIMMPPINTGPSPADAVREPPSVALGAPRCRSGFVWREASQSDYVCVTPESRARVHQENAVAASRVNPQGAYGPNTCIAGFVWREAFQGDLVCVTPEVRDLVRQENATAPSRTL